MRVTTKGRYALRAVIALAKTGGRDDGDPVSIRSIAEQEELSAEFLEQIFFRLRKAGVIKSVRGPGGGFYLAKPSGDITLLEILEACGEGINIASKAGEKEDRKKRHPANGVWDEMDLHVRKFAEAKTLEDMLSDVRN